MCRILMLLAALSMFTWISPSSAAPSRPQCDRDYDKCKKDVKHMFDKKPCKEARERCIAAVGQGERNLTKERMLGRAPAPGNSMRQPSGREAAEQRMRERAQGEGAAPAAPSMRERVSGESDTKLDPVAAKKAEALRRMKERQQAKTPSESGSMREAVKSN